MGFGSNGIKTTYSADGFALADLADVGLGLRNLSPSSSGSQRPNIAIDSNWVAHQKLRTAGGPVASTCQVALEFASKGFITWPICDGRSRPISKQASNQSRAKRRKGQNKATVARVELRTINETIKEGGLDEEARNAALKKRTKLQRAIKSGETQATKYVPAHFHELLADMLINLSAHDVSENGGTVKEVMTAEFQADSLMGGMFEAGDVQLLLTADVDLPIVYGDKCIIVTNCSGNRGKFTIRSTSKAALTNAISFMHEDRQSNITITDPDFPIFEGLTDRRLRVLIMVIIGCDVCPDGVYNAGVSWVSEKMRSISKSRSSKSAYDQLIDYAVEKDKRFSAELLNTYVDAVVYEPINEDGMDRKYMDEPPTTLESYSEEFKLDSTAITTCLPVKECKCTGTDSRHKFLAAVDHFTCTSCQETICRLCVDRVDNKPYCLECGVVEQMLPGIDHSDFLPIWQMRDELKNKYKVDHVDELTPDDVEEMYVEHELHRALEELCGDVQFPVLPTSAINDGDVLKDIADIDLSFGGAFIRNPDIEAKYIPRILELMASLVFFDTTKTKYTNWQKESIFSAMPKLFIDIASKCRARGLGYRLLKRCLRHAMDSRTEPLDVAAKKVKLVLHDENVGIVLSTPIAASMKQEKYDGTTVITKDELLCAECDCKSGSKGNQKIACVHTPTRPYMLTLLLAEDLAEHILIEFASMVSAADMESTTWSEEEIASMKKSIIILVQSSGNMELAESMMKETTLYDMLKSFKTGTQKSNEWRRASRPSPEEIKRITEINFASPEHKAKVALNKAPSKPSIDPTIEPNIFEPDYAAVGAMLNAANISPSKIPHIGFELLSHRREKLQEGADSQAERLREAQPQWDKLMKEAAVRSRNFSPTSLSNLTEVPTTPTTPLQRRSARIKPQDEEDEAARHKKRRRKYRRPGYKKCAKVGCPNHSHMAGITMHRIPKMPGPLKADAKKHQIITWRKKKEMHLETMDRCGYGRNDTTEDLRICNAHKFETHTTGQISYTHNRITISESFQFSVLEGAAKKSSLLSSETTKGLAGTRGMTRIINEVQKESIKASSPITVPLPPVPVTPESELEMERRLRQEAEGKAAEMLMVAQQVVECHSMDDSVVDINPTLARVAGLVPETPMPVDHPSQKRKFKLLKAEPIVVKGYSNLAANQPPSVTPEITAAEMKRLTGFPSVECMLGYIITITNGDIDLMRKRCSSLTWFEEWFRYFEWKYGKVNQRQCDRRSEWGCCMKQINRIIDSKSAIELGAMLSWPRYASYSEDLALRDATKYFHFQLRRVILWDMTNIPCPKFEDGSVQRSTYSKYYGQNCFKGGVGNQLCGWGLAMDLWGGAISDDNYDKSSGYMQDQDKYAQTDLVDGIIIPFTNIKDRGYRTTYEAWKQGKQTVLQPKFAKSDERFTGHETIYSGLIARDRSGNERGVNVSKRSALFKRGFQEGMSAKRFNDAWLTWSFQANFMYKRVV